MSPETVPTLDELHLPAGALADGDDPVVLTPQRADWRFAGLRVIRCEAGAPRTMETGDEEWALLPLVGEDILVEVDGERFRLAGRESVFHRVSDFAYVPRDSQVTITCSEDSEIAIPSAVARRRLEPLYVAAEDIAVETRGAGQCTRQITNFLAPDAAHADRLVAVEVLTPEGNWSSYPPHKHDEATEREAELEEIYWFRVAGGPAGWGSHRTYDLRQGWDVTATVRDGDTFLVPSGYHGPDMAPPGYDMYFLNVLAGPGEERSMAFTDDPSQAWIRESWRDMELDPRVPMTSARGPVSMHGLTVGDMPGGTQQ